LKPANPFYCHSVAARLLVGSAAVLFSCDALAQQAVSNAAIAPEGLTAGEVQALQGPGGGNGPEVSVNERPMAETPRRFQYHFTVTARGVYDDNINISSFDRVSDYYFAIEPALSLGFGAEGSENSLTFIYRPSLFVFADHSENDTVQHLIRLQGGHEFGRLSLSLSQNVQILDGADINTLSDPTGHTANIDVGQRTRHNVYTTQLSDSYDLTGKLFLSNSFGLLIDDYSSGDLISSETYTGDIFINYNYSAKVVAGIGGTVGYQTVDQSTELGGNDQTFEQANVRVSYAATGKISLNASGGVELRQFGDNGRGTYVTPVYSLAMNYQPFDGTSITLSGSRRNQSSASLGGQDFTETDINFAVNQRFLRRFSLGLAVGYENLDYFSTVEGGSASRTDDYYYVEPSVDFRITRFWTAGAYYLHRENSSSLDFFSFYDNQFGVRTSLTF
jgi:hypothetical protein